MEKEHLVRMKDLYGEEGEIIIEQMEKREKEYFNFNSNIDAGQKQQADLIQVQDFAKTRSTDITKLVSQINELAVIFKELSILVVEQGTLLDRIDYNIEATKQNVKKTNLELTKTVENEKSFRAKGCMICLVQTILIMTGVLIFKHY
jgi:syntaxin 16